MNTNINTDNYEAYLLDYMEGNLSPDEAEQLKAFVVAQGLDWNELTEELPHLEAPAVTYQGKERLKKKATLVPLYVKIASAAAAVGLLLTVTLWPEKSLPKVEPIAELKPILPQRLITTDEPTTLPPRTIRFVQPQVVKVKKEKAVVPEKVEMPLVAQLEPKQAQALPSLSTTEEPDFILLAYQTNIGSDYAQIKDYNYNDYEDDGRDLSLISRGIYRLTDGRHNSFGSLITTGLQTAKKEINLAATDFALTAYYRADEHFEEVKENWQEKRGD
jgi:hypothetical protein